jgi:triacylglycerol lipase
MLIPPLPWERPAHRRNEGPMVVLLHGLWRSRHAMNPLARALHDEGFATLNLPYPSTRHSIPQLADLVGKTIRRESVQRPVFWVTHSLGGILARAMLAQGQPAPRRLVMIAPPNQGSEIVDHLRNFPIASRLLGPAGRDLGTGGAPSLLPPPPATVPTMVIMGNRSAIPLFRSMLAPDNDGIVSVDKGRLAGAHHFHVVEADHTYISIHPETLRLCLAFFREADATIIDPGAS